MILEFLKNYRVGDTIHLEKVEVFKPQSDKELNEDLQRIWRGEAPELPPRKAYVIMELEPNIVLKYVGDATQ